MSIDEIITSSKVPHLTNTSTLPQPTILCQDFSKIAISKNSNKFNWQFNASNVKFRYLVVGKCLLSYINLDVSKDCRDLLYGPVKLPPTMGKS